MLDINFIKENKEVVARAIEQKGIDLNLDKLLELDIKRRELILKVDGLRRERNEAAQKRDIETGKALKLELDTWEIELKEAQERFEHMMLYVPNIPSEDSPIGKDSSFNKEIFEWGQKFDFKFTPKSHVDIAKNLGIVDFEMGTKVSGFRGYYLKGQGALLHLAILNYAVQKITQSGFTLMIPPTLVHEKVLVGSGQFPFGKDNIYQISNPGKIETGQDISNPVYLVGTSEPSLLGYFADRIVSEEELPIKVAGISSCYRSEVGDYGRDTKGLYRVHEFSKVEQVVICRNNLEESEAIFKEMQSISESILQELNIPYHVIATSTGDMGAGKYRMNDIEAWMPGRGSFGETHSNSNLTDWQARRLNLKFKTKAGEVAHCYTLNNTVIASPRILIAILENFQQEDGSVIIPEALRPFTGFDKIANP